MVINKVREELGSFCIISSLGQVKFSLDNYLSMGKYKILLFPHPC